MDTPIDTTAARYVAGGAVVMAALTFLLLQPTSLVNWLRKKNYQYEVTFALYMLTPTEKFIFNSILFLTLSFLTTASFLYLPDHITTILRRGYYYFAGDSEIGSQVAAGAWDHALNTVAAAQEAVGQAAAAATGGWS